MKLHRYEGAPSSSWRADLARLVLALLLPLPPRLASAACLPLAGQRWKRAAATAAAASAFETIKASNAFRSDIYHRMLINIRVGGRQGGRENHF